MLLNKKPAHLYVDADEQKYWQRVRVLERIVTDRGYDIATQIEALRDQRRVEEADTGVSIDSLRRERA
jgi:hypothetical protein